MGCGLEVLLDEVHHHVEQVQPGVAAVDAVVAVRVDKEVKILVVSPRGH